MSYLHKKYPLENPATPLMLDQLSLWSARFGELLLEHIPMRKGMQVLDIGCGTGFPLIELAQRLGPRSRLIGYDLWKEGLKRARWKAKQTGVNNVELINGSAAEMPFENNRFDLIVSNLGINNFDDPPAVMKECHRVLKGLGRICITTNLDGHFYEFYKTFRTTLKETGNHHILQKLKEHEARRGSDESVRDLFENAGFSVSKLTRDRFTMRFVDGTAFLNHFLIVIGFLPSWRALIPEENVETFFQKLEANLNKQAEWEEELKLSVPMIYVEGVKKGEFESLRV
ncbi:MAG TPA: class I SAM-dependent methyltransferase [Bacteroidetes bacterium]|nr:class I SAM-dependent methyltransferase [Bacteroidota bacterium]